MDKGLQMGKQRNEKKRKEGRRKFITEVIMLKSKLKLQAVLSFTLSWAGYDLFGSTLIKHAVSIPVLCSAKNKLAIFRTK